jgi:hypothetical protein
MKEEGGRIIVIPVKRRDRRTLEAAIMQWVKPFTTIITDGWGGYTHLGRMGLGYNHLMVNHQMYFVHPVTGANTNTIESSWRALRANLSKVGIRNESVGAYITRYVLVSDAKLQHKDLFKSFLRIIGSHKYPLLEYDDPYYSDYNCD